MTRTTPRTNTVLVLGGHGVLGSTVAEAFTARGWNTIRGSRRTDPGPGSVRVDLDQPDTISAAMQNVDLVVNTVPDADLVAEGVVLDRGGYLINIATLPESSVRRLRNRCARTPSRGAVVLNAGLAPGVTNLVIADLLHEHPDADTVEFVMALSSKGMSGRAGVRFVHENLTTAGRHGAYTGRHTTAVIPLPEPIGPRRCFGFAEREGGWIGTTAGARAVRTYGYIDQKALHTTILTLNPLRILPFLPLAPFMTGHTKVPDTPSTEPVTHWISVLRGGVRIAARTVSCEGDYLHAAAATAIMGAAFLDTARARSLTGCFNPEQLFTLPDLGDQLHDAGITVATQFDAAVTAS